MKRLVFLGLFLAHILSALSAEAAPRENPLAKTYRQWIDEEVVYLISKDERKAFLALAADADRNAFIKSFWARLDPFPLTPENEFRDEHERRLRAARDKYGVRTDRGRIYILLGPPADIDADMTGKYVVPCEIWNYSGLSIPTLPTSLRLLFYKPLGFGELKLYSPLFDGLEYLVPQRHYDFKDARIGNLIREFMGIEFLRATESVSPGYDELQSEKVLSTLRDPQAIAELKRPSKSVVTTFVTYEKFPLDVVDMYVSDGRGSYFYDAGIQVAPADISFEKNQDKYYGRQDVYITITDEKGNAVSRANDQLTLELIEEEMQAQKGCALAFRFSGRLLPGTYALKILVRDFVSNRIGEKETTVVLPAPGSTSGILLAAKSEQVEPAPADEDRIAAKRPFVFGSLKFYPRASRTFGRKENIVLYMEVYPAPGTSGELVLDYTVRDRRGVVVKTENERKDVPSGTAVVPVGRVFSPADLPDGEYVLSLSASGPLLPDRIARDADFTVTSAGLPPGEFSFESRAVPSREETYNNLGLQSLYQGLSAQAATFFSMALNFAPDFAPARINLARCRVLEGHPDASLELLQPLVDGGLESSELYVLLGNIHYGRGDLAAAAGDLETAAGINVESVDILNFLGSVYLEAGRSDEARRTFERSLKIKGEQPLVKSLLERIGK
jgi:GWxTD domain-containing protein